MTNIYQFSSDSQRFDEASLWISKIDKGLSRKEEAALEKWLAQSKQNQQVFLEMAELWDKGNVLSRLTDLFPQPVEHKNDISWPSIAVAASLIAVVFSLFLTMPEMSIPGISKPKPEMKIVSVHQKDFYQTAIGEQSTVNLPDGTQITLNTNTQVKVSYTDRHRFLILEHGELHVDVAHDELRPLSVIAGAQIVQAIGTAFNIELHSDQRIELVVTEGKVRVGTHGNIVDSTVSAYHDELSSIAFSDSSRAVSEGHQLILGDPEEDVEIAEPAEIKAKLSWRDGNLIFRGESLDEAIREISRYTSVRFVFNDRKIKKKKVVGLFKAGDVNGLLETLEHNFDIPVSYQYAEGKVLLGER